MRPLMRTLFPLVLLTIAMTAGATRLAAQCTPQMDISVYSDGDAGGSLVYAYSSTVDNSTLCSCVHSDYQSTALLQLASGA